MYITGVPKEEEKGPENLSEEILAENFHNLGIQVQEVKKFPNKINPQRFIPRHIIKMLKVKNQES